MVLDVAECPGERLVVLGNHDFDRKGGAAETGFDRCAMGAVIRSTPPLVVAHLGFGPLPEGHANVYGHVHNNVPLYPGPRINACAEHTEYKPLAPADVRGWRQDCWQAGRTRERPPSG